MLVGLRAFRFRLLWVSSSPPWLYVYRVTMNWFQQESAYEARLHPYRVRADHIMVAMNVFLTLVCLAIAPLHDTWAEALLIAMPTLLLSYGLMRRHSGELINRIFVACAFMTYTSLIIHQSNGDIEAHFSAFGLIGVLLYYRDWRTIFAATVFIYLHHLVMGYAQILGYPIYVFDQNQFWPTFALHVAYFLPFVLTMGYLSVWLRRDGIELLVAKENAEAASELKNNFLTNISHEMLTPMNGVLGLMELLQEGNLTEQQREHLTWAQASGNQLLVIINDILDLSNMESGAMKLELSAISLQDVLDQLFDSFRLMALKKDVKLSINVSDKVPAVVMTDATHIRKIFSHLIDNAIKFTTQGEINVWVDADAFDHDKNSFQLYARVKDSGIGFDMSRAENLFLPFVQGDNSLTRAFGGSGLGLAIVRKLVQRLGGDIQATSRPGVGSEFSFHILCLPSPNKV